MPQSKTWYKEYQERHDYSPVSDEQVADIERRLAELRKKHGPPTSTRLDAPAQRKAQKQARRQGYEEMQDYFDERAETMFGEGD